MKKTYENISKCVRCGTCAQSCFFWNSLEDSTRIFHPRNKMILLNFLFMELLTWFELKKELPNDFWIHLNRIIDACSSCWRCETWCPVNINTWEAVEKLRDVFRKINYWPWWHAWIKHLYQKLVFSKLWRSSLSWLSRFNRWKKPSKVPYFLTSRFDTLKGVNHTLNNLKWTPLKTLDFMPWINWKDSWETVVYLPWCHASFFDWEISDAIRYLLYQCWINVINPPQLHCWMPESVKWADIDSLEESNYLEVKRVIEKIQEENWVKVTQVISQCPTCIHWFEWLWNKLNENWIIEQKWIWYALDFIYSQLSNNLKNIISESKWDNQILFQRPCHQNLKSYVNEADHLRTFWYQVVTHDKCCWTCGDLPFRNPSWFEASNINFWNSIKLQWSHQTNISSCWLCLDSIKHASKEDSSQITLWTAVLLAKAIWWIDWREKFRKIIESGK